MNSISGDERDLDAELREDRIERDRIFKWPHTWASIWNLIYVGVAIGCAIYFRSEVWAAAALVISAVGAVLGAVLELTRVHFMISKMREHDHAWVRRRLMEIEEKVERHQ